MRAGTIYLPLANQLTALLFSSQTINDLDLKLQTLKLLEENIDNALQNVGIRKDFLNRIPLVKK